MSNFGTKILNNAVSSLNAQQALIALTGNNIANVNTPGYSRRAIELQTNVGSGRGELQVGSGVSIGVIKRITDSFIETLLRNSLSQRGSSTVQNEFMNRIENLFDLTGNQVTIGSALSGFYTAINDLAVNPSSIELRSNMIQSAQDLVQSISNTYNELARMQREADQRIGTELSTVNSLTTEIARLNQVIRFRESSSTNGSEAVDERDVREKLIKELSEKVSFSRLDLGDGTVNISLSNGFPLVLGDTSRALGMTDSPSFAPGSLPPALDGGSLGYIVYDFGPSGSPAHVDLTQVIKGGSGSIAGLLSLRGYNDPTNTTPFEADGTIPSIASRVEAVTRYLLTNFNQTYLGPDRDGGTAGHQPSSGDLNGNTPTGVFAFFTFAFDTTTYGSRDRGGAPDGYPTSSDLDDIAANTPVRSFSSLLQLNFTDPAQIAAALDSSGGPPAAPIFDPGDGRNLLSLAALKGTAAPLSAGNFTLTATLDDSYNNLVNFVGNLSSAAQTASDVADANLITAQNRRDAVSAVSLDEEFSSLIVYQKAYQASARMIRIADELLEQILQAI